MSAQTLIIAGAATGLIVVVTLIHLSHYLRSRRNRKQRRYPTLWD